MEIFEEIAEAVECILSTHHYDYRNFGDSRRVYFSHSGFVVCYDAMTLHIYNCSLNADLYDRLYNQLCVEYRVKFGDRDKKKIEEYDILRSFCELNAEFGVEEIKKLEQPDFELLTGDGTIVGVEVTKLTTENDSVLERISSDVYGLKMSSEEVKTAAYKKHGHKALNYRYRDYGTVVGIGNAESSYNSLHLRYAEIIAKKFEIYKTIKKDYDKFILLCNGCHKIFNLNEPEFLKILEMAKKIYNDCADITVAVISNNYDNMTSKLKCNFYKP